MARTAFSSRRNFHLTHFLHLSRPLLVKITVGIGLLLIVGSVGGFWYITKDLPEPGKLSAKLEGSTVIYDRDGKIVHQLYRDKQRIFIKTDDIPDILIKATVAIEDKDFYTHGGFDPFTVFRIPYYYFFRRGQVVGGSTLTQQLIKQTYLDSSRTVLRKVKELVLAIRIEQKLSKAEILTEYLNIAPYGGTYEGIGAASKGYFDKKPADLTILESAILAGLPQAPSLYSPFIGRSGAWRTRTKDVLRRMYEDGYIKKDEYDKALKDMVTFTFAKDQVSIIAPHFVFYVRDLAEKELGPAVVKNGVRIKTTLDLDLQKKSEEIVKSEVLSLKDYKVGNGAALAVDTKTGEIRAMVGSYDFNDDTFGKFNVVADPEALRQPGSTLKPLLVAMALDKKLITASSLVIDAQTSFPIVGQADYRPVNYDGKFRGPVQVRFALGNSLNIPMVKLMAQYGVRDFLGRMQDFGVESLAPTKQNTSTLGLSIALGGGDIKMTELAQAYSVLARGGTRVDLSAITEIADPSGRVLYRRPEISVKRVISPEATFIVSHILSDNNARQDAFGPSSLLNIPGKTVAVKTGTTNDKHDNWTAGYTNGILVITWVGNNDNTPMNQKIASGITGASPIWNKIMKAALKTYPDGIQSKPDGVQAMEIDSLMGGKIHDDARKRSEYFIIDSEPKEVSGAYQKLKISKNQSPKKANDAEIAAGQYEEKDFIVLGEADPVSTDGKNRWQEAIDAWIGGQSDDTYKVPRETSDHKPQPTSTPAPTSAPTGTPGPTTVPTPTSTPGPTNTPTPTPGSSLAPADILAITPTISTP